MVNNLHGLFEHGIVKLNIAFSPPEYNFRLGAGYLKNGYFIFYTTGLHSCLLHHCRFAVFPEAVFY
jgi:hypothetical protein